MIEDNSVKTPSNDQSNGLSTGVRLVLVIILFTGLIIAGKFTGIGHYFSEENVRQTIETAGYWGYVLYFVLFAVGIFIHVPGLIFVAAGVFAYGKVIGLILGLLGGNISVWISFIIVRRIGGKAFTEIDKQWVKKLLEKLDDRPIRTVIVLRLIFFMAPALNYMLALTSLRFRDFLVGSFFGLMIPITGFVLFIDWIMKYLF